MKKGVDAFHLANADFLVESKDLSLNEVIVNVAVNNTVSRFKSNDRITQMKKQPYGKTSTTQMPV